MNEDIMPTQKGNDHSKDAAMNIKGLNKCNQLFAYSESSLSK
jgi:hypothetical protein